MLSVLIFRLLGFSSILCIAYLSMLSQRNLTYKISIELNSSLWAKNSMTSSETSFQIGSSISFPIRHDDSNRKFIKIRSKLTSSEISINKRIVTFKTSNPNTFYQSSSVELSKSDLQWLVFNVNVKREADVNMNVM